MTEYKTINIREGGEIDEAIEELREQLTPEMSYTAAGRALMRQGMQNYETEE